MGQHINRQDLYRLLHDLKTPLGTISGRLQMALKDVSEPHAVRNILQAASSAHNLLRKFYNLYDLVSIQDDHGYPGKGPADLAAEWAGALKTWAPLASAQGVAITGKPPAGLMLAAAPEALRRILDNLLSNALLHPEEPKVVGVMVERGGGRVRLMLRNDGIKGGRESEFAVVSPDFAGGLTINGLGLPAVQALAERAGGEFSARFVPGAFVATLSIPAAEH